LFGAEVRRLSKPAMKWIKRHLNIAFSRDTTITHVVVVAVTAFSLIYVAAKVLNLGHPDVRASHGCSDAVAIIVDTTWSTNQCHGAVTVTAGATLTINGGLTADITSLTLGDGVTNGFIVAKGDTTNDVGVVINADSDVEVKSGSTISANGQGFAADTGPGGAPNGSGGGGTHGGQATTADAPYGSTVTPLTLGSGGDGAAGGGAIKLNIGGNLTENGTITANGNANSQGGGAGGSVYINFTGGASTWSGSANTTANGGTSTSSGGGGGGRLAVTGYVTDTHAGTTTANGGTGGASNEFTSAAGTVFTKSSSQSAGTLVISNNNVAASSTKYTGTNETSLSVNTLTIQSRGILIVASSETLTIASGGSGSVAASTKLNNQGTLVSTGGSLSVSGTYIADGTNTMGDITVASGGVINHTGNSTAETFKATISAANLTVNSGGLLDVNGLGYDASNGPGFTSGAACYGGHGFTSCSPYGSTTAPTNIGSGGSGASGAGAVILSLSGNLTNNGTIRANGTGGVSSGSGGTVSVTFTGGSSTWSGSGGINANGGAGGTTGGGGGGGRVAVVGFVTDSHSGATTAYAGTGGTSNSFGGAPGTVYTKSSAAANGTLVLDNSSNTPRADTYAELGTTTSLTLSTLTVQNAGTFRIKSGDTLTVASGGTITHAAGTTVVNSGSYITTGVTYSLSGTLSANGTNTLGDVTVNSGGIINHSANTTTETNKATITAPSMTISSGGAINLNALGFQGGATTGNAGSGTGGGAGGIASTGGGGGAYGGAGGNGNGASGGAGSLITYGSQTAPVNIGSGGGSGSTANASGGSGGGALRLTVTGALSVSGTISANGGNGLTALRGGGGGSGGSVYITAASMSCTSGAVTANGGNGAGTSNQGGGGGGGRIAVIVSGSNTCSGSTASGGTGNIAGSAGTVYGGPGAPVMTAASAITTSSITWNWTDQSTTETTFKLQNSAHSEIASINSTTTAGTGTAYSYQENSLSANTEYVRHVHSHDGSNESVASSDVDVFTLANAPGTPTLSSQTTTGMTVTLNQNSNPAGTQYAIFETSTSQYVQANGTLGASAVWQDYTTWGGASGKAVTGLSVNTQYTFEAKARNGNNVETAFSSTASSYTLANTPGTPTVNTATASTLKVTIAINSNPTATEFAIHETTNDKYVQADGTLGASAVWQTNTNWGASGKTVSGLTSNTTYTFNVKARNGNNTETSLSSTASGLTLSITPGAPTLSAFTTTGMTVTVAPNGNGAGVEFAIHEAVNDKYVQANGTLGASAIWQTYTNWGGASGTAVTGLSVNTQYTFEVKARNSGSVETALSASTSKYTLANTPSAPTVSGATVSTLNVVLNVNSNPAATEFAIHETTTDQYVQASGALGASTIWATNTTWGGGSGKTVTGLTRDTTYTFEVKARNGDNTETSMSSQSSGLTIPSTPGIPTISSFTPTGMTVTVNQNSNPSDVTYAIFETTNSKYVQADGTLDVGTVWRSYTNWGGASGIAVTGLSNSTTYTFQVKARNTALAETPLSTSASGATGPAAPTGFTSTAITTTSITWGWTDASTTETSFLLHDNSHAQKASIASTTTGATGQTYSYEEGSLSANTQYSRHVHAYDGTTQSDATSTVSKYTAANTPGTPTVSASATTSLKVTLNTNSNPAATEFAIQETSTGNYVQANGSLGSSPVWQDYSTWGGASGQTVSGLSINVTYTFQVKARNGDTVQTGFSSTASLATLANIPSAPTVSGATTSSLTVVINANSNHSGTEFAIHEATTDTYVQSDGTLGASTIWQTRTNWGGASGKTVTGLTYNTTYTFEVKARNEDGVETAFSSQTSGTPLANVPGTPTLATVSTSSVKVTLNANSNPASTEFAIFETSTSKYVQANGSLNTSAIWQTYANWGGASGTSVTGLSTNVSYTFKAKARNGDTIETAFSSTASKATFAAIPGAPSLSNATGSTMKAIINENGNPAGTEFAINETSLNKYVQADGTLGDTIIWQTYVEWGSGSGTTITGLQPLTTYTFAARARNNNSVATGLSSTSSLATEDLPAPPTVNEDNNTATTTGVTWKWIDESTTETSFKLHDENHNLIASIPSTTTGATGAEYTYTESGLSPNGQYLRHVHAFDTEEGLASDEMTFYTLANTPNAPTASSVTSDSIKFVIDTNSNSSDTQYAIYESNSGQYVNASGTLAQLPADKSFEFIPYAHASSSEIWRTFSSWGGSGGTTVSGLTPGGSYSFEVKARNGNNVETALSSAFAAGTDPTVPGGPDIVTIDDTSVRIYINTHGNSSNVQYAIRDDSTSPSKFVQSNGGTLGSDTVWKSYADWGGADGTLVTGLTPGTEYRFVVIARIPGGTVTEPCPVVVVKTRPAPVTASATPHPYNPYVPTPTPEPGSHVVHPTPEHSAVPTLVPTPRPPGSPFIGKILDPIIRIIAPIQESGCALLKILGYSCKHEKVIKIHWDPVHHDRPDTGGGGIAPTPDTGGGGGGGGQAPQHVYGPGYEEVKDPWYVIKCHSHIVVKLKKNEYIDDKFYHDPCVYVVYVEDENGNYIGPAFGLTITDVNRSDVQDQLEEQARVAGFTTFIGEPNANFIILGGVVGAMSLLTGMSTLTGATSGVITLSTVFANFTSFLNQIWYNLLSWRKKKYAKGRVFAAWSNKGIRGANVLLYQGDNYQRLIDRTVTNGEGRYGFYVAPGTYMIKVTHPGYSFPSRLDQDGYHGKPFTVKESGVIAQDIPTDPTKSKYKFVQVVESLFLRLQLVRRPLLGLGALVTILNLVNAINIINLFFLAYYAYLIAEEFKQHKKLQHVLKVVDANGQPAGFAVVRLTKEDGQIVFSRATDATGRVFLVAPKGKYTLEIATSSNVVGESSKKKQELNLPNGTLDHSLTLKLT
jgi:hypothetical protein